MNCQADREQLGRVVELVRDVLGSDAVGAYLFGSAVLGALQSESDLDVLVVSKRRTTRARSSVSTACSRYPGETSTGRWRRIELTIVLGSVVNPWRYPPAFDFQYGDWLRDEFERGNVEPWPSQTNPDLATLISMVLLAQTPLLGPPPAALIDDVPQEDLRAALVESIDALLDDLDGDTRNVILTLARVWSTMTTGVIRSKQGAADWALPRLPAEHRPVLARARAIYLGDQEESWDDLLPRVRPHVAHVVAEIRRRAGGTSTSQ